MSQRKSPTQWTTLMTNDLLDICECIKVDMTNNINLRTIDYKFIAMKLAIRLPTHAAQLDATACKNKIKSMRKKYKQELEKKDQLGGVPSAWEFFEHYHSISFEPMIFGDNEWVDNEEDINPLPRYLNPLSTKDETDDEDDTTHSSTLLG